MAERAERMENYFGEEVYSPLITWASSSQQSFTICEFNLWDSDTFVSCGAHMRSAAVKASGLQIRKTF